MNAERRAGTWGEMSYRATVEDFREALRARMRATLVGRTRWRMILIAALPLAYAVVSSLLNGTVDMPFLITPATVLPVLLFGRHPRRV
ncbi:hypothetical protein [Streptomyces rimosus]|uniref:hypothetical protein n=1 Tax=Streptomyces rimosus TaxID=1927 RepID=UPI0004CB896F|nr:hypothetical protein [Streptomyces rimosus]